MVEGVDVNGGGRPLGAPESLLGGRPQEGVVEAPIEGVLPVINPRTDNILPITGRVVGEIQIFNDDTFRMSSDEDDAVKRHRDDDWHDSP